MYLCNADRQVLVVIMWNCVICNKITYSCCCVAIRNKRLSIKFENFLASFVCWKWKSYGYKKCISNKINRKLNCISNRIFSSIFVEWNFPFWIDKILHQIYNQWKIYIKYEILIKNTITNWSIIWLWKIKSENY